MQEAGFKFYEELIMANAWHVSPETLRAGECRAGSPETCLFAQVSDIPHYKSKEEAIAKAEEEAARRYGDLVIIQKPGDQGPTQR